MNSLILEHALLIGGIPFILIILGYIANKPMPLVLGGIGLIVASVFFLAAPITFTQLDNTTDHSLYWPCNNTIEVPGTCTGNPDTGSCSPYNAIQCRDIDGCAWLSVSCTGTPTWTCDQLGKYDLTGTKCGETSGCAWTAGHTETVNASCDLVVTTSNYANVNPLAGSENDIFCALLFGLGLFGLLTGALSLRD